MGFGLPNTTDGGAGFLGDGGSGVTAEELAVMTDPDELAAAIAGLVSQADFDAQGPSGRQLAYAESTVAQSGISGATDLTGLTITFDVGARPVDVTLSLAALSQTTVGGIASALITDAANTAQETRNYYCATVAESRPLTVVEHIITPGTYTRKGRIARITLGTVGNGVGAAIYTSFIQAIER